MRTIAGPTNRAGSGKRVIASKERVARSYTTPEPGEEKAETAVGIVRDLDDEE